MANDNHLLFCLIEGDTNPFEITVSTDRTISHLRDVIWEKRKTGALRDVDPVDLVLWMVSRFSCNYLVCS